MRCSAAAAAAHRQGRPRRRRPLQRRQHPRTAQTELTTASALTDATTGQPAETTKDKRQAELDKSYRSGYDKGYADGLADGEQKAAAELKGDTLKVWVSGDFTATVRHLTEDFVSTPDINTAVVTLFQDGPFVLQLTAELCKQIQAGKTYTFTVDGAEAEIPAGMVWDENYVSPEALMLRKFRVTGVREPKDDEYGLECWRVKYTKQ